MKKTFCAFLAFVIVLSFCGCNLNMEEETTETTTEESTTGFTTSVTTQPVKEGFGNEGGKFLEEMKSFPSSYKKKCSKSGTLEEISYSYGKIKKKAIVYLPNNYSDSKKYNVLYLIGGGKSDHTVFFEKNENGSEFQNYLDNAILNGDIDPVIVVNLAFYPDDNREITINNIDSLLTNFADELRTSAIPAVEGKYSTYAKSTKEADIISSRKHRAFGGFSQGANASWMMLALCPDLFYYYLPMCGGDFKDYVSSYKGSVPEKLRESLKKTSIQPNEYFLYCANGTDDYTKSNVDVFVSKLKEEENQDVFTFTNKDKSKGNATYKVMSGASHLYSYCYTYALNGIMAFWNAE